jgi:hypothetical protein
MKTLITILSTAAFLTVAITASGFELDAPSILAIAFASGFAGMFAGDYKSAPRYDLVQEKTEALKDQRKLKREAGVEFATFASFNSTCS